jgi:multidrug resistance protein, MATE family
MPSLCRRISQGEFLIELKLQFVMSSQVCIQMLCKKSVDIVSVIFIGHLSSNHYLSAAGIATVTANVFGNSFIMGLGGPLSTLCSQAYGARNFKALKLSFQQSIAIMTVLCCSITLLWCFGLPIMRSLGQSHEIARDASQFLLCLIPALFTYAYAVCIQFCLYAQQKPRVVVLISMVIAIMHPFWCYFFMKTLDIGFLGAAYAISTSRTLEFLLLVLYMRMSTDSDISIQRQIKWTWEVMTGWQIYFQLGAPNILMMSEWWASETIIFMAGFLSDPDIQISSLSIFQNVGSMCFMLPRGLETAGCSRVGNALGKNEDSGAFSAAVVCVVLQLFVSTMQSSILVTMRHHIGYIFFNPNDMDEYQIELIATLMLILAVYTFADGLQCAISGLLKGAGKQRLCGPIVLCCYFVVAIPVAVVLSFRYGYDVLGLATGTTIGTWLHFICYAAVLYHVDWKAEASIAHDTWTDGVQASAAGYRHFSK